MFFFQTFFIILVIANFHYSVAIVGNGSSSTNKARTSVESSFGLQQLSVSDKSKRKMLQRIFADTAFVGVSVLSNPLEPALAGTFTPGGTLVDREVGVQVGNPEASLSRMAANENVLFTQDSYFKFGSAAPWIEPDTTEFPKAMPFTPSQQRYDALKKYGERVKSGAKVIDGLGDVIKSGGVYSNVVADPSDSVYALRPMGLLANNFMATENSGTTNELLLARWYVNEMYLRVGDIRGAKNEADALQAYVAAKKAVNSYLAMLNRVITSKVGEKFNYLTV